MPKFRRIIFIGTVALCMCGLQFLSTGGIFQDLNPFTKLVQVFLPIKDSHLPWIYVVTPTNNRRSQIPDLTRLSSTLLHVKRLHWIVIEDAHTPNIPVAELLNNSGIMHSYLFVPKKREISSHLKGITQRNAGISWIRKHHDLKKQGVVYFADDDNTYTLKLFDEIRFTKKVSIFPTSDERILLKDGKVIGFKSWGANVRKFATDMSGFALNVKVFFDYPEMHFRYTVHSGHQETKFLEMCCTLEELEPKGDNCTKVIIISG